MYFLYVDLLPIPLKKFTDSICIVCFLQTVPPTSDRKPSMPTIETKSTPVKLQPPKHMSKAPSPAVKSPVTPAAKIKNERIAKPEASMMKREQGVEKGN